MGMFDSLYDADGNEWQTKAMDRVLARYCIGDLIGESGASYQMEVVGGYVPGRGIVESFATITAGRLTAVPVERDTKLALIDYGGHLSEGSARRRT